MIIPMKKITVLCLDSDKVRTLEELRDLSILHTSISTNVETADVASLAKRLAEVNRAGLALLERKGVSHAPALDAEKAVDRVNEILDAQSATEKSLENLNKEYERLRPWGNFSPAQIHELERKGIFVTLCTASPKAMPELPEGVTAEEISRNSAQVCLALISRRPIDIRNLNTVQLPERSMNEIETEIREHQAELQNQYTELENLTSSLDAIREYRAEVEDELTFARNRDGMGEDRAVAYLNGYVPVDKVEELRKAAAANGWALLITDPDPGDDQVPTCIRKPKWLNIMDPLFDFIGVTPGYRENDVNLFFLIFFPIFFGMLIGDAGYGVLFIATALICKYTVCKGKEGARLPLNLFLLLSCMSLIWGWLNGAWFGIPRNVLPSFMQGLNFLADPAHSPLACEIAGKAAPESGGAEGQVRSVALLPAGGAAAFGGAAVQNDRGSAAQLAGARQSRLGAADLGQLLHGGESDRLFRDVPDVRVLFLRDRRGADRRNDHAGGGAQSAVRADRKFCRRAFLHPSVRGGAFRNLYCGKLQ